MHRLTLLLSCSLALAALGNPMPTVTLNVTHVRGCEVRVEVGRPHGMPGGIVERARARFAFENWSCTQPVSLPAKPTEKSGYDQHTTIDTVCGDGKWFYRVKPVTANDDYFTSQEVEVKGCSSRCSPLIDAPTRVRQAKPAPPCKVQSSARADVGKTATIEFMFGKLIRGEGVLEVLPTSPPQVKGLRPGVAWFENLAPRAEGCIEITVRPDRYQPMPLEAVKQWAFRNHEPGPAKEERVVELTKGGWWPAPLDGTLAVDDFDPLVRMGVDAECRPGLRGTRSGNGPYFTGVTLTEANGDRHRYVFNLSGEPLGLPCRVTQHMKLRMGELERTTLPAEVVSGDDVAEQLPGNLVRPTKVGAQIRRGSGAGDCMKVTVEPALKTRDEKIAAVRRDRGDTSTPTILELKVGQRLVYPFPANELRGNNDGIVDAEIVPAGLSLVARYAGFTGLEVKGRDGERRFLYVEVSP